MHLWHQDGRPNDTAEATAMGFSLFFLDLERSIQYILHSVILSDLSPCDIHSNISHLSLVTTGSSLSLLYCHCRGQDQKPAIREGLKRHKDTGEGNRKINFFFHFWFCLLRSWGNVQNVISAIYAFFKMWFIVTHLQQSSCCSLYSFVFRCFGEIWH